MSLYTAGIPSAPWVAPDLLWASAAGQLLHLRAQQGPWCPWAKDTSSRRALQRAQDRLEGLGSNKEATGMGR